MRFEGPKGVNKYLPKINKFAKFSIKGICSTNDPKVIEELKKDFKCLDEVKVPKEDKKPSEVKKETPKKDKTIKSNKK